MTNGRVDKTGSAWNVFPNELDEMGRRTKISVYARLTGGERLMGTMDFRVKKFLTPWQKLPTNRGKHQKGGYPDGRWHDGCSGGF